MVIAGLTVAAVSCFLLVGMMFVRRGPVTGCALQRDNRHAAAAQASQEDRS